MAAQVLISEFVADNEQGLRDEDGDREDWIELHNAGDQSAALGGWFLTDDAEELDKWRLPEITLEPEARVVVFASGKDRATGDSLHTNFRLRQAGEYLALVRPGGTTVEQEFSPAFPSLPSDRSYGIPQATQLSVIASAASAVRAIVPNESNGAALGLDWTSVDFDDDQWLAGDAGVGFDASGGFDEFIGLDITEQLFEKENGAYVRKEFAVANPASLSSLQLRIQYEDGFIAYLNGVEVARANAPEDAQWNSVATAAHRNSQARLFKEFDLTPHTNLLLGGKNVLAIHGMNRATASNDFLIGTELSATEALPIESTAPKFFKTPTPGLPNDQQAYAGITLPVTMDRSRGFYDEPFDVLLTSTTPGASLVFTIDGSRPSETNGVVVAADAPNAGASVSIRIENTTNLRAVAMIPGYLSGAVTTESYFFLDDVIRQDAQLALESGFPDVWRVVTEPDYGMDPDVVGPNDAYDGQFSSVIMDALKAAPTVSIATDLEHLFGEEGIYVNSVRSGSEWERATSVEILMPDGRNFQADAGIRIQGDNVRNFANSKKQSFRLEFREEYGPTKLRFPLFDSETAVDSFDTIILRGGYNDGWVHTPSTTQFIRDQWARATLQAMGNPQVHGRFVHVYLNGFYWGLYNAVERPVASFASDYFGGDKDDWDALNTGRVRDGNNDAWTDLRNLVRAVNTEDQSESNAAYQVILGNHADGSDDPTRGALIDVQNYIDYLIVNFYGGNVDWPGRNYYVARQQGADSSGFKFFAWDTEKILDHGEGSTLTTNRMNERDGVAAAYFSLRNNDEFRLQFADRVHKHFFNGGVLYVDPLEPTWDAENPHRNQPAARYHTLARSIELPLVAESARWGDTQSDSTRQDNRTFTVNDWLSFQNRLFDNYFPRRSSIVLDQFIAAGLYPSVAAPTFNQHGGTIGDDFALELNGQGTIYYTLDGSDPRQSSLTLGVDQSGVSPTALTYAEPVQLGSTVIVRTRALVDGVWSALNEAVFKTTPSNPIRVSELMYHPRETENDTFPAEAYEFIEFVNSSSDTTISLEGLRIANGVEFAFPNEELTPGERAVVANNRAAFIERYGDTVRILGEYGATETRLDNGGERLALENVFGEVVHEFEYDDQWFPSTDGGGFSLAIIDVAGAASSWNEPSAWRQSVVDGGAPGRAHLTDFDLDGVTTPNDIDIYCRNLQGGLSNSDLNGDRQHDVNDLVLLIEEVLGIPFGDVDLDGRFDSSDLTQVFQFGVYEDAIPDNALWSQGDWNCDGDFTTRDFVDALRRGGYSAVANVRPAKVFDGRFAAAIVDRAIWELEDQESNRSGSRDAKVAWDWTVVQPEAGRRTRL